MSVSVVIPAYNAEKYLSEALQSVLAQTLLPQEIVVVDDGSTDGTAALAESFGPLVRVIRTANQRAAAGRNLGVKNTTGEWIAFLDADDVWEPSKLEKQMAELAAHPEADVCYTPYINLWQEGDTARIGAVTNMPSAADIRKSLLRKTTFIPSCAIVRRSAFLSVGGFDPTRRHAQDWDLWVRMMAAGATFIPCQEPLMRYRTHPDNMSANVMSSLDSAKDVYSKYILPQLPPLTRWYHHRRFLAEYEGGSAAMLRGQGSPKALPLMLTSILRHPFCVPKRYKTLALMLYTRLRNI
jgi:glycosyltransferase involved in cell wall biosynthesis